MLRCAFAGFGEINTPREIIEKKCSDAVKELESLPIELITVDPVSDDPKGEDVKRALAQLEGENFDCLVVCIAGWIPSHAVISITSRYSHLPMLLWGLTGYFRDGRLVTTADQAGTSALRGVFEDLGYQFTYAYSTIAKGAPMKTIGNFFQSVQAMVMLKTAKVGMMGYRDMRLYGTMYDAMLLKRVLGTEIEFFEMLEMVQRGESHSKEEIQGVIDHIFESWNVDGEPSKDVLLKGASLYLSVKQKALEEGYDAVSLIDVDGVKKLLEFPPAMVFMLLDEDPGVCTIPENDALGSVTQLITRYLTGQRSAYMEFYEFMEDRVLMGVPDFVPAEVVDGGIKTAAKAFGDFGAGLLNVSTVKTGKVTLARLTQRKDGYALHAVTGEAVTPRSWAEEGWDDPAPQLPSLEIILDSPVEEFTQRVLSQHYIITYGDNLKLLSQFCRLAGIEMY